MSPGDIVAIVGASLSVLGAAIHLGRKIGSITEEVREIRTTVEEIRTEVRGASDGLLKLRTEHDLMMRRGGCVAANGEVRT